MSFLSRLIGPPTQGAFARKLIDMIHEEGETLPLTFDEHEQRIASADRPPIELWIGQAYAEYCALPASCREQCLRRWTHTWFTYRQRSRAELNRRLGQSPARARFGPTAN